MLAQRLEPAGDPAEKIAVFRSPELHGLHMIADVRNLRRDVNDELKKAEKAGELTEDDLKKELEDTQKTIEKAIKDIDGIIADKEKELMEV